MGRNSKAKANWAIVSRAFWHFKHILSRGILGALSFFSWDNRKVDFLLKTCSREWERKRERQQYDIFAYLYLIVVGARIFHSEKPINFVLKMIPNVCNNMIYRFRSFLFFFKTFFCCSFYISLFFHCLTRLSSKRKILISRGIRSL